MVSCVLFMFVHEVSQYSQVDKPLHPFMDYIYHSEDKCQWPMYVLFKKKKK